MARGERPLLGSTSSSLRLALAAVGVSIGVQLLPLPVGLLDRLGPSSAPVIGNSVAGDRAFGAADSSRTADPPPTYAGFPRTRVLSIDPRRTMLTLVFFTVFVSFFLVLHARLTDRDVRWIASGILVFGAVLALSGMLWRPMVSREVEGVSDGMSMVEPSGAEDNRNQSRIDTFGPFGNRNHFAGWMVMSIPLAMGYVHGRAQEKLKLATTLRRARRTRLPSRLRRDPGLWLMVGALLLMTLSVFVTLSRSGIGCLVLALLAFGAVMGLQRKRGAKRLVAAYSTLLLIPTLFWAASGGLGMAWARYAEITSTELGGRLPIWRDALSIVRAFPLTGTGMNTYDLAASSYETTSFHQETAHNEYLELAADGGLLVGAPALFLIAVFIREVSRRFREDADDVMTAQLRTGAAIGVAAIAFQALFEFSLQMPGNMVLFVVLCAIAVRAGSADTDRKLAWRSV